MTAGFGMIGFATRRRSIAPFHLGRAKIPYVKKFGKFLSTNQKYSLT